MVIVMIEKNEDIWSEWKLRGLSGSGRYVTGFDVVWLVGNYEKTTTGVACLLNPV